MFVQVHHDENGCFEHYIENYFGKEYFQYFVNCLLFLHGVVEHYNYSDLVTLTMMECRVHTLSISDQFELVEHKVHLLLMGLEFVNYECN